MNHSEFEFPVTVSPSAPPDDIVFCGKVITRPTEPGQSENRVLTRTESSSGPINGFAAYIRSPSGREGRCRRSERCRRRYSERFGTVLKFPLQMELSDIKMKQDRRKPLPPPPAPPRLPAKDNGDCDGGESCWELVLQLRRGRTLKNALLGCFIPLD